ncbi:MAG: hypothetical protein AB7V36_00175 [Bacteroidales bacterium]
MPNAYLDPAYPSALIKSNNLSDVVYIDYLNKHLFPLPDDGNYERAVEIWVKNNIYFPQFLPAGNPAQDSARYMLAADMWMQKHPEAVDYITNAYNATGLSDDDLDFLISTFPRKQQTGNADLNQRRYEDAVQDWIRQYSFEKYQIVEPLVREAEMLNQNEEGVK